MLHTPAWTAGAGVFPQRVSHGQPQGHHGLPAQVVLPLPCPRASHDMAGQHSAVASRDNGKQTHRRDNTQHKMDTAGNRQRRMHLCRILQQDFACGHLRPQEPGMRHARHFVQLQPACRHAAGTPFLRHCHRQMRKRERTNGLQPHSPTDFFKKQVTTKNSLMEFVSILHSLSLQNYIMSSLIVVSVNVLQISSFIGL